ARRAGYRDAGRRAGCGPRGQRRAGPRRPPDAHRAELCRSRAGRVGPLELRAHRSPTGRPERALCPARRVRRGCARSVRQLARGADLWPRLGAADRGPRLGALQHRAVDGRPVIRLTWVDTAPWGWAPYHYGRWVFVDGFWAWAPGPIVHRAVYAPALVV